MVLHEELRMRLPQEEGSDCETCMKMVIKTTKPEKMKELLEKSSKGVSKYSKGFASFDVKQLKDDEFEIDIDYALSNPVFNWQYKKSLKKAILDFDPEATFR